MHHFAMPGAGSQAQPPRTAAAASGKCGVDSLSEPRCPSRLPHSNNFLEGVGLSFRFLLQAPISLRKNVFSFILIGIFAKEIWNIWKETTSKEMSVFYARKKNLKTSQNCIKFIKVQSCTSPLKSMGILLVSFCRIGPLDFILNKG